MSLLLVHLGIHKLVNKECAKRRKCLLKIELEKLEKRNYIPMTNNDDDIKLYDEEGERVYISPHSPLLYKADGTVVKLFHLADYKSDKKPNNYVTYEYPDKYKNGMTETYTSTPTSTSNKRVITGWTKEEQKYFMDTFNNTFVNRLSTMMHLLYNNEIEGNILRDKYLDLYMDRSQMVEDVYDLCTARAVFPTYYSFYDFKNADMRYIRTLPKDIGAVSYLYYSTREHKFVGTGAKTNKVYKANVLYKEDGLLINQFPAQWIADHYIEYLELTEEVPDKELPEQSSATELLYKPFSSYFNQKGG